MDRTKILACLIALILTGCARHRYVTVSSKDFTESFLLAEIAAQHLENQLHQPVYRKFGLGGTLLAQQGLLTGDIDMYPEYTGTAYTIVLKRKPISDPAAVLQQLREAYQKLGLEWLPPLGFNNSFAMAVRGEEARARHLATLSDAARDKSGFVLGAGYEFMGRPDGYDLLTRNYPINWNHPPKTMDLGLLYKALQQKQVSMVAGSVTDGQLAVVDAKVLEDDKHVFPPYQACMIVRSNAFTEWPVLREALNQLDGKINNETMRKLNYEVDGKHRPIADVARDFLHALQPN